MKTKKRPVTTAAERRKLMLAACDIAREAGAALMQYYARAETDAAILKTEIKDDCSPVTAADKAAHDIIVARLSALTPGYPVISEENATQPVIIPGKPYWVVDPLDGTKEFLHRTGGFAVKIALMDNDEPVIGTVFCPAQDVMYFSGRGMPAFRQDGHNASPRIIAFNAKAPSRQRGDLRVLFNEKHVDREAYEVTRKKLAQRGLTVPDKTDGAAGLPRNLRVAEGLADIFMDCGSKKSLEEGCGFAWDYAPDWLILRNAGGIMIEINSGREMDFRHPPCQRRNAYVAFYDKKLGKSLFPKQF